MATYKQADLGQRQTDKQAITVARTFSGMNEENEAIDRFINNPGVGYYRMPNGAEERATNDQAAWHLEKYGGVKFKDLTEADLGLPTTVPDDIEKEKNDRIQEGVEAWERARQSFKDEAALNKELTREKLDEIDNECANMIAGLRREDDTVDL